MAKVFNQEIPVGDVLHDPDPARPHTLGEGYQQAVTEGYTGVAKGTAKTVRVSPKKGRPSERGAGTPKQQARRECFTCCAEIWRNLTAEYKACLKEIWNNRPPPIKKKDIPPEFFSSPYNIWMRECLKACRDHGCGGVEPEDLFPCENYSCLEIVIQFTTVQMQGGETQNLSYTPRPNCDCHWESAGGGFITGEGAQVEYTAPASNPQCAQNGIINLVCANQVVDTLNISVNTASGQAGHYFLCTKQRVQAQCSAHITVFPLNCNGEVMWPNWVICASASPSFCPMPPLEQSEVEAILSAKCAEAWSNYFPHGDYCPGGSPGEDGYADARTWDDKEAGCCPAQL